MDVVVGKRLCRGGASKRPKAEAHESSSKYDLSNQGLLSTFGQNRAIY